MAMQKAVVNSNFGWCKELIDDGINGFLIHPSEHQKFGKKIVELIENTSLNQSVREAALRKVQHTFSIQQTVEQNIRFYQEIINKQK